MKASSPTSRFDHHQATATVPHGEILKIAEPLAAINPGRERFLMGTRGQAILQVKQDSGRTAQIPKLTVRVRFPSPA